MAVTEKGINNKIEWKLTCHMSGTKEHSLLYRAEFMGKKIQCEIHTPVKNNRGGFKEFGKQKVYFFYRQ